MPARGLPSLVAGLALAAASCVEALPIAPDDPSRPPEAAPDPRAPIDVQSLAREVATVRRLPLKQPVRAQPLAAEAFVERYFRDRGDAPRAAGDGAFIFWTAFGFAPPSTPVGELARRMHEVGVRGFYDTREKALFVRGGTGDGDRIVPDGEQEAFTLAHEIEHALQDQSFGIDAARPRGTDEVLAYRALIEGDASLTEIAVRAQRKPDTEHWVSRVTAMLRGEGTQELLRRGGVRTRELQGAPPLLQRMTVFPYVDGLAFVADLYRAGGVKLLDRAFSDPPRSTEQVLHTDRYLAGDAPVPVPVPAAPAGWALARSGTMGELATGMLLEQCFTRHLGVEAARGWGGDAYAIVSGPGGRTAVLWSTAWDDDAAATRFAAAAMVRGNCERRRDPAGGLGGDVVVLRTGKRVAYVQGLGADADEAQARLLLAVPVEAPPLRPPFGAVTVPPLVVPEDAFLHKGRFERGAWLSEPLGIRIPLPEDFAPDTGSNMEGAMKHLGNAYAAFTILMASPGADTDRVYMRKELASLRDSPAMKKQSLDYAAAGPLRVAGTDVPSYTWRATKGSLLRLAFVPACGGRATAVLFAQWAGLDGQQAIDDWTRHFGPPDPRSPLCLYLSRALD